MKTANLTWEQKFEILSDICDLSIRMRSPGDWYVDPVGRYICGDGLLRGEYGNGTSPQDAVENDFAAIVENLPSDRFIKISNHEGEKYYRFEGFRWREYKEAVVTSIVNH